MFTDVPNDVDAPGVRGRGQLPTRSGKTGAAVRASAFGAVMASTSVIFGALAAAVAPLFMSIGFCFWDLFWRAHPFSLNVFKCTIGGIVFLCIAAAVFQLEGE